MAKNKNDLINELAAEGYVKDQAKEVVNDILTILAKWLVAKEDVSLRGFGGWKVRMYRGHLVQNANTREKQVIGDYPVISFKPGDNLKDALKSGDLEKLTVLLHGEK